ncbi:hypothetical protein BCR41DRAFT_374647 [Lobosporangium transversale]|uniref:Uncharacterized protein n=1 Tax=Lobosporangium transversale TaxID=64571 RepID=A0A1Y2G9P1_9FUNG|nr:hypothetical protein BCR41DRAFT_374647 [Lobosporangium transversale]ORZ04976.1 hypothetical protein BCR41DRAFT_374647 [Lobosporangium transversale]|eukprot:XP_021876840.1 hypothetical protein BCR41DRAFT_374647 [Lobosporangium transversale]
MGIALLGKTLLQTKRRCWLNLLPTLWNLVFANLIFKIGSPPFSFFFLYYAHVITFLSLSFYIAQPLCLIDIVNTLFSVRSASPCYGCEDRSEKVFQFRKPWILLPSTWNKPKPIGQRTLRLLWRYAWTLRVLSIAYNGLT